MEERLKAFDRCYAPGYTKYAEGSVIEVGRRVLWPGFVEDRAVVVAVLGRAGLRRSTACCRAPLKPEGASIARQEDGLKRSNVW